MILWDDRETTELLQDHRGWLVRCSEPVKGNVNEGGDRWEVDWSTDDTQHTWQTRMAGAWAAARSRRGNLKNLQLRSSAVQTKKGSYRLLSSRSRTCQRLFGQKGSIAYCHSAVQVRNIHVVKCM